MNNIKNDLLHLINKNIDVNIKRNIKNYVDIYNDEQLIYMLDTPLGLKLNETIYLKYKNGIGYSCYNSNNVKQPETVIIERILNNKKNIEVI